MGNPLQNLEALQITKRDRVPVEIAGAQFQCRTRLKVADVMALPQNFFLLQPFAISSVLFRLLGYSENGVSLFPDDDDNDWYNDLDALAIHRGMTKAGVLSKVMEQLRPAEEEAAAPQGKE